MIWSRARTYPSREAWLAARRLGSSDVAAILGLSSFRGPFDVWMTLRGEEPKPETADQRRGKRWERIVLAEYQDQTGNEVFTWPDWTMFHGDIEWETSTPDAAARDSDTDETGLVEAKTDRRSRLWGESSTLERWHAGAERLVRPDYAVQCYHQLLVTGAPWCDLAVLLPSYELRVYRLFPDHAVERELLRVLGAWWQRHVVDQVPPSPDASAACRRFAAQRMAAASRRPKARVATDSEVSKALFLYNARENRKHFDAKEKLLSAELAACLEPGDAGLALDVEGRPHARAMWQRNHFRFYGMEADNG